MVGVSGVTVTIPAVPDADDHAGMAVTAPNPAVATGIAKGLSYLGAPYVPGTVTACDHSPESLALPRCLVMCCAGLRWAVLSRPGVRGTTDDGADEQRVGQVESH